MEFWGAARSAAPRRFPFHRIPAVPRIPSLPPGVARRNRPVLRALGRAGLALMRWDIEGEIPDLPKFVLIMAPHTSNWDFVVALLADLALDMEASWMGKHTIFKGAFGTWLRGLGGIPVVRHAAHNVVTQMVGEFRRRDRMILGIAPEGTRKQVARWKSGYWHIAHGAGVPILPAGLDFGRRTIVIGPLRHTTGSLEADEGALLSFFATITPRHPRLAMAIPGEAPNG